MREWCFEIRFVSGKHVKQVWTFTNLTRSEILGHYENLSIAILREADITIRYCQSIVSIDEFLKEVYGTVVNKTFTN